MTLNKWDEHFYQASMLFAGWSTCLSRQVGAIIVRDKTIISTGFNGPPRGVTHCGEERIIKDKSLPYILPSNRKLCPRQALSLKSGQGLGFCTAAHAEENAIINAARIGVSTLNTVMYMSCGIPCKDCLKKIINAGIIELVCVNVDDWYDGLSKFLIQESGIKIRNYAGEEVY